MSPSQNLADTLRRVPLLNDLSEAELVLVAERVNLHHYDAGAIIFTEGDICHELWIVQSGSVKLLKMASNGRQQLLAIERAGNSLSEVPVFDGGRYPATAEALGQTTLLRLDADHFRRICLQFPNMALKVIKVLGHRLRHMSRLVEELSFSTVRGRLIAHLSLAEESGHPTPQGIEFILPENNEELAARLGTVRELVSRNLGRLHSEKWIAMRRRSVTIPDIAALQKEIDRGA